MTTAGGLRRELGTAFATKVLLAVVLAVLAFAAAAGAGLGVQDGGAYDGGASPGLGVLSAAGVLFFVFAGYARIATLGEEVRNPSRTIPRAILGALAGAVATYLVLGLVLLGSLGPARLATSPAPVAGSWASIIVQIARRVRALGPFSRSSQGRGGRRWP